MEGANSRSRVDGHVRSWCRWWNWLVFLAMVAEGSGARVLHESHPVRAPRNDAADEKVYEEYRVDDLPVDLLSGEQKAAERADLKHDSAWAITLDRGHFDWYVGVRHIRLIEEVRHESFMHYRTVLARVFAGRSIFRISKPLSTHAPIDNGALTRRPGCEVTEQDWHYVIGFVQKLKYASSSSVYESQLLSAKYFEDYKPDPRFDFWELEE